MHTLTVDCDTFTNDEEVTLVTPVTSVDVTGSKATFNKVFILRW